MLIIDVGASGTSVFTLEKLIEYFLYDLLYFNENVLIQKCNVNISPFCWISRGYLHQRCERATCLILNYPLRTRAHLT